MEEEDGGLNIMAAAAAAATPGFLPSDPRTWPDGTQVLIDRSTPAVMASEGGGGAPGMFRVIVGTQEYTVEQSRLSLYPSVASAGAGGPPFGRYPPSSAAPTPRAIEAAQTLRTLKMIEIPLIAEVLNQINESLLNKDKNLDNNLNIVSRSVDTNPAARDQLITISQTADAELERDDGILNTFLAEYEGETENPRKIGENLLSRLPSGAQSARSVVGDPSWQPVSRAQFQESLTKKLVSVVEEQDDDEASMAAAVPVQDSRPIQESRRPVRERKPTGKAQENAAQAAADAAAKALKAEEEIAKAAERAAHEQQLQKVLNDYKNGIPVAVTPYVDRSGQLSSISSSNGQVGGNYGAVYLDKLYRSGNKQCWICGLSIDIDSANPNEYEHVQPFKTALFESLLYVPANALGHEGREYIIARQCIGEYSHDKCNGGGATTSRAGNAGGRIGKGDMALKMGGKNGNWDDLVPNEAAIKKMLVGDSGDGKDTACIWHQLEQSQRTFFGSAKRFYDARKDIIYARVAQVCFMVRLCVDWNKHALAKGYALARASAAGSGGYSASDKKALSDFFKTTSALNSCPPGIADKFKTRMYMQPFAGADDNAFGESLNAKTYEEWLPLTIRDFNASYGTAVTGIGVGSDISRILQSATEFAKTQPPPPAAAAAAAAPGSGRGRGTATAAAKDAASGAEPPPTRGEQLKKGRKLTIRKGLELNRAKKAAKATPDKAFRRPPGPDPQDGGTLKRSHQCPDCQQALADRRKRRTRRKRRHGEPKVTVEITAL